MSYPALCLLPWAIFFAAAGIGSALFLLIVDPDGEVMQ